MKSDPGGGGSGAVSPSTTPGRMGPRMSSQEEVAFVAADLQELNHPEGIFSDQWLLDDTTTSALHAYIDHISPDNLILMVQATTTSTRTLFFSAVMPYLRFKGSITRVYPGLRSLSL